MPPTPKRSTSYNNALRRPPPPEADYSDEVTDEHHERIKGLVKEDEHKDAEVTSGPAW